MSNRIMTDSRLFILWAIYGFRLDLKKLWFQVDHTRSQILFQIDHGKVIETNLNDLYIIIIDQCMINPAGKPWILNQAKNFL